MTADQSHALDHVVVVLFENRSLDNVLGRLYGPSDGKSFDGVIGKDLSNPIPTWAEHGAERKEVPYTIATDMDSPNPDSGEEFFHTNTQLSGGFESRPIRSTRKAQRNGAKREHPVKPLNDGSRSHITINLDFASTGSEDCPSRSSFVDRRRKGCLRT